jgi:lysyl-tRNA synthetase class I
MRVYKMAKSNELILPTSPTDIKKLQGMVEEAARCLQKMDDQREAMKDIFSVIKEDFQIAPKYSGKLAKTYYKNNFHESQAEQQEFESLYELIIGEDN